MAKQSQAWKELEREAARVLAGKRKHRMGDYGATETDVEVPGREDWKIDCKYRSRWNHHSYLEDIASKYCLDKGSIPILVTKHHRQRGACVTLRLSDFADIVKGR